MSRPADELPNPFRGKFASSNAKPSSCQRKLMEDMYASLTLSSAANPSGHGTIKLLSMIADYISGWDLAACNR